MEDVVIKTVTSVVRVGVNVLFKYKMTTRWHEKQQNILNTK